MNIYGYTIIGFIALVSLIEVAISVFGLRHMLEISKNLPEKILSFYKEDHVLNALGYQRGKTTINILERLVSITGFIALFYTGIITNYILWIESFTSMQLISALLLFISFGLFFFILELPFTVYNIFFIEKRFGFNKITPGLFIKDLVMNAGLLLLLLTVVLFIVVGLVQFLGDVWWIYSAIFIILLSLFMTYVYPSFIAPIFNSFKPLNNDVLNAKIKDLAEKIGFTLDNIYQMDASKRSTHSNAYLTGFGKKKRIVLFDSLLSNHDEDEIVSILAHEFGHYKLGHIRKNLFASILLIFGCFYFAHALIDISFIYTALGLNESIFAGLFIIYILFSPLNFLISPIFLFLSRRYEYEADQFSVKLTGTPEILKRALVKLHKNNLSNPIPDVLEVILYYSHPPLIDRVDAI